MHVAGPSHIVHQHTCSMQILFIARIAPVDPSGDCDSVCCIGAHLGFAASSNICTCGGGGGGGDANKGARKLKVKRLEMPLELHQHLSLGDDGAPAVSLALALARAAKQYIYTEADRLCPHGEVQ